MTELVHQVTPPLLEPFNIGADTAAEILPAAGDSPHRIKSEAALAKRDRTGTPSSGMTSDCTPQSTTGYRLSTNRCIIRPVARFDYSLMAGLGGSVRDLAGLTARRPVQIGDSPDEYRRYR